jgi:hypothetical protein
LVNDMMSQCTYILELTIQFQADINGP